MCGRYEGFKEFMVGVENVTKLIPTFWTFTCELFVVRRGFECSDM